LDKKTILHEIKLSSRVTLPGNIFLAPMAGFTDRSFRHICVEHGADLCFTEMVSCEALVRGNDRTINLAKPADNEQIYAVQIFSASPSSAATASKKIAELNPLFIDLNCGCPVPKIIKSGAGSALMNTPEKIGEIVKAVKGETGLPVTVKIRSGWDVSNMNFLRAAEIAQEAGAAMISLHPRTRSQGYSGKAAWEKIKTTTMVKKLHARK
jgi:nifR3 family TIM-barrel protein